MSQSAIALSRGKRKKRSATKRQDLIFQLILLAWPVLQFAVFYIYVNINSLRLAFNFGENLNGGFFYYFETLFANGGFASLLKSALISIGLYLSTAVIAIPLALIFAYYISRKYFGSKFFKFFLFLPSIISAMVMSIIFLNFCNWAIPEMAAQIGILMVESITSKYSPSSYVTLAAFYIFINLGTTTMIYSNRMSELPNELYEAAALEGVKPFQEFWYIVLPFTYPTLTTFIVTGVATIFTNQYNLFTFYSSDLANMGPGTIGYIIYNNVQSSAANGDYSSISFHQMAALGILCTIIIIPIVFGVKYLLEHKGPSED